MAPLMTSPSSPPPPPPPPEDAGSVRSLSLSSLLQSAGGYTHLTAASSNPSALPSNHATFSSINKSIPNGASQMVLDALKSTVSAAVFEATSRQGAVSAPLLSSSATPHAITPRYYENKTDSSMTHTMRLMAPCGVNECAEARQPQVIKPCTTKGKAGQELQAKPLKKGNKRLNKDGLVTTEGPTTLMIRGIPCSLSQEDLMALIDDAGLKDKYDFFYLPVDTKRNKSTCDKTANLGYAFVNFVDQKCAEHCTNTFTGVPLAPSRSTKKCAISPADVQGIPNLQGHFRRSVVSRGAHGPMFLKL
jgi:hypothetical protein